MSDHLKGLNSQQAEAVHCTEGALLVLAGAGTGKTRVVTSRIAHIVSKGVPPSRICAVTFTNKAAKEMRARALKLLGKERDELVVSTFHSLGARILRDHATALGLPRRFTIADSSDQVDLVADALRGLGIGRDAIQPKDAHFRISLWKNAGLLPDAASAAAATPLDERVALAYARYEEALVHRDLVDFDDLILKPLVLLEKHAAVLERLRQRWKYLLVDEYQDTNGTQYRLMKLLAGPHPNVCVVGDDDQSIYAWRGAEPDRILRFTREYPGAKVVTLEQNYRSTMTILRAANRVIGRNVTRRAKKLWSALGDGDPITLYVAPDDKDEMDFVGRTVSKLIGEGVPIREIAVLFRANRQCRPLEQALRTRRVPYRVIGTFSFFDRREVRDLLAFCRVALNSADDPAFLRIVNTPPRGIGKSTVDALKKRAGDLRAGICAALATSPPDMQAKAREGTQTLLRVLRDLESRAAASGTAQALTELVESIQYRDFLRMEVPDPLELQTRLNTIDELVLAARECASRGNGSLEGFLESLSLREETKEEDDERPAVSLLTVHAAKGLEFQHVMIVGVEDGIMPHKSSVADEDDGETPETKGLEEERRLFYVALTRARHKLWLSRTVKRTRFGKEEDRAPSRFLEDMGSEGVETMDATSAAPATKEFGREIMRDLMHRLGRAHEATP